MKPIYSLINLNGKCKIFKQGWQRPKSLINNLNVKNYIMNKNEFKINLMTAELLCFLDFILISKKPDFRVL